MLVIIDYMGTNFYARIIPSKSRKEKLKKLIDEDRFDDIKDEVADMYDNLKKNYYVESKSKAM